MTVHEVLVAARNYIDREGWWDGGDDDETDPSAQCVSTACQRVGDEGFEAREVLLRLLGQPTWRLERIYDWNDAPGRTKAEVLDLFDRAIASTAPEPDLASLNLNENGGRKDWNALEDVHAALREEVAR